jgi:hypothetical protein
VRSRSVRSGHFPTSRGCCPACPGKRVESGRRENGERILVEEKAE